MNLEVTEKADRRVYDLRYIVNRAGTFDLKDYLVADDGSALTGLPNFKFEGDPKLSKNLDTRIQETEEIRIDVGGRYYEWMALFTLLWIGWLLLLIFWKRPKPPAEPDAGPPPPTLAEMMRSFLTQIEAGTLNADAKAKMEMVMLQCWRNELALGNEPMDSALAHIASNGKTSEALKKLQHWLHHPSSPVPSADIAAVIKPYTLEAASGARSHPTVHRTVRELPARRTARDGDHFSRSSDDLYTAGSGAEAEQRAVRARYLRQHG